MKTQLATFAESAESIGSARIDPPDWAHPPDWAPGPPSDESMSDTDLLQAAHAYLKEFQDRQSAAAAAEISQHSSAGDRAQRDYAKALVENPHLRTAINGCWVLLAAVQKTPVT